MELSKYIACICEGAAESAIVDILVDNDLLIFSRGEMLGICPEVCRGSDDGKSGKPEYRKKN